MTAEGVARPRNPVKTAAPAVPAASHAHLARDPGPPARAALRSDVGERMSDFGPGRPLPAPARYERFLRTMLHHQQAAIVVGLGIMSLTRGNFVPDREVTRAEAATAFYRFLTVRAELKEAPLRSE